MKRNIFLLAGLLICVAAVFLVISKTVEGRKSGDDSSSTFLRESKSSAEHGQESEADTPRAAHRQRSARENIDVLSRLGFVLTADDIGDHRAKGNVQIISPDGAILRSDSVSISSDGDNIFLTGKIKVELLSDGPPSAMEANNADSFAKIALDGGAFSFQGKWTFTPISNKKKKPNRMLIFHLHILSRSHSSI